MSIVATCPQCRFPIGMHDFTCTYEADQAADREREARALAAARLAGKLEGLEMAREIAEPHHQIVAWTITARIAEIEKGARDDDAK